MYFCMFSSTQSVFLFRLFFTIIIIVILPSQADPLLDGDDPVYPGAPLTKGQSLLLLMSYILRHNLTAVSLDHLLKIFNEHFPGMVPVTTYLFRKAYGQYGSFEPHFYCPTCENYW